MGLFYGHQSEKQMGEEVSVEWLEPIATAAQKLAYQ
jgi:hypothetical protein